MQRMRLIEQLAMAEQHLRSGERHIAEQRLRIAALRRHGHDASRSLNLLHTFEQAQLLHRYHRDRLRLELRL